MPHPLTHALGPRVGVKMGVVCTPLGMIYNATMATRARKTILAPKASASVNNKSARTSNRTLAAMRIFTYL